MNHGYAPMKNKNGDNVVVVRSVSFFNKKATDTSGPGSIGQQLSGLVGVTPIVGDLAGRAVAAAVSPGGNEMWVSIQFARGPDGDDWDRLFPAEIRREYPAAHLLKKRQWVLYKKTEDGKPDSWPCPVELDCLPVNK